MEKKQENIVREIEVKKWLAFLAIDLKNEPFTVYEGDVKNGEKASATVTVDDEDFVKLASGQLNPQKVVGMI